MIFLSCCFIASLALYLEAHKIPDLPVSYENSIGSLGPICQTPSFCSWIVLGIQIVRAGAQRGVGPHGFTIFPLGGWGIWIIYVPDAQIFVLSTVQLGTPAAQGRSASLPLPSLLGHQSTHSLLFLGAGKEWMGCWDSDSEMLLLVCRFCWVTPSQGNKWDFPDCSLGLRAGTE